MINSPRFDEGTGRVAIGDDRGRDKRRRAFWLKQLHQWHWVSAAISLVGMILFSVTGITLNHAAEIRSEAGVERIAAEMPPDLLELLDDVGADDAPLPEDVRRWLARAVGVKTGARTAEWSEDEIYLSLAGPGSDAWLAIDRKTGAVEYERRDRGWIAYLNDLHKGRDTGAAWRWFIDVFALACIVFSVTGLFLLQLHAERRPGTWPLVGLGFIVPFLLAVFFIHG